MSWYRTSLAAAMVVASLSGLTSCDGGASYPVQAAYGKPGPYATTTGTVTGATGAPIYDEYYPASYAALGFKSPIVTWGNGTGGKPADVAVFLRHLASYGFTVIATTLPNTGSGKEIDAAARYLIAQDSVPGSVFYHRLDITEVAAIGTSQGAGGAVRAATNDAALYKTVLTFSLPNRIWANPNPDCPTRADCTADPAALTQPVFFISTHGPFDAIIASPATERGYFRSTKVHAALGIILFSESKLADHTSIAQNPGGFLGYATAWLEYRLRGDTTAAPAFTGNHPELLSNTNWPGSATKLSLWRTRHRDRALMSAWIIARLTPRQPSAASVQPGLRRRLLGQLRGRRRVRNHLVVLAPPPSGEQAADEGLARPGGGSIATSAAVMAATAWWPGRRPRGCQPRSTSGRRARARVRSGGRADPGARHSDLRVAALVMAST